MKNLKKYLFSLALMLTLMFAFTVKAEASDHMSSCTNDSVTITWDSPSNLPSGATLNYFKLYDSKTGEYSNAISPSTRTITISGLGAGYTGSWRVYYYYTYSSGYQSNSSNNLFYVNTTPAKMLKSSFGIYYYYTSSKKLDFEVVKDSDMTGVAVEIRTPSGKKVAVKKSTSRYIDASIGLNKAYKYRVKQYYTNSTTGKTYYGPWSTYKYFSTPSIKLGSVTGGNTVAMKINKISGISKCKVAISTSKDKGYKSVGTFKPGKVFRVSKCGTKSLKKYTTYYIKITPINAKKKYTPVICDNFYIKTVYR